MEKDFDIVSGLKCDLEFWFLYLSLLGIRGVSDAPIVVREWKCRTWGF